MIVPEDSYFRRMQAALSTKTRIELDAILFSSDVISICYSRLEQLSTIDNPNAISFAMKVSAIADAWSIVDQIHVLRQLFGSIRKGVMGPKTTAWHVSTSSATLLRNGMDHIAGNLKNLSNRSGNPPPVLGAVFIQKTVILPRPMVTCIVLAAGQSTAGASFTGPVIDTQLITNDVRIEIQAFKERLNITQAVSELRPLLAAIASSTEAEVDAGVAAQGLSKCDEAAARAVVSTGAVIISRLGFEPRRTFEVEIKGGEKLPAITGGEDGICHD
jgi:hypothetical protein